MASEDEAASPPGPSPGPSTRVRFFDPDASVVLVGCRGAGKRTLGFIAAAHLRRRLVTEDHFFAQATGVTRAQFLAQQGPDAFAACNAEVFRQMLAAHPRRCVIECGMSSLGADAQALLRAFGATHPVVYVHREREQILRLMDAADADALLRADLSHRQCSNYEYYNLYDGGDEDGEGGGGEGDGETVGAAAAAAAAAATTPLYHAKMDFIRFLDLLQGQAWRRPWAESPFAVSAIPPEFRPYSYALRLRLSDLVERARDGDAAWWASLEARGDCVELIVDTWPADVCAAVARAVAQIRRAGAGTAAVAAMPIVYHVEERPRQERSRPLAERDRTDAELLELGLRLNVEYLSLDLDRSPGLVHAVLARRGRTRIVGNYWFAGLAAPPWTSPVYLDRYAVARALGCDVVRIARFGHSDADGPAGPDQLQAAVRAQQRAAGGGAGPPLVAFDYSLLGVQAPLQGRVLNPVKHPDLANRRDHLATVTLAARATALLFVHGRLDSLRFYTVGARIAASITPVMHRAAFAFTGLRHTFRAVPCTTLHALRALFVGGEGVTFGGATLAAPFKVAVRPLLQLESPHAAALGAVNVLLPLRGDNNTDNDPHSNTSVDAALLAHARARNRAGPCRALYGDNTDWTAVHRCLQRALSPRNEAQLRLGRAAALVVGAGGMARAAIYALLRLGCRHIVVYNRTPQHAHAVAEHFNAWAAATTTTAANNPAAAAPCQVLASAAAPWPADAAPPTMVVSCVPAVANFTMPSQWLGSPTGGVVIELAYDPLLTPLLAQMRAVAATPPWVVVDGLEVVSEMAIAAFELLTGRPAPTRLMRAVCRKAWAQQQLGLPLSAIPMPKVPLVDADVLSAMNGQGEGGR